MERKELTKKELEKLNQDHICDICLRPIDPVIDGKPVYIKTGRGTEKYICMDCISKTQKGVYKDA